MHFGILILMRKLQLQQNLVLVVLGLLYHCFPWSVLILLLKTANSYHNYHCFSIASP